MTNTKSLIARVREAREKASAGPWHYGHQSESSNSIEICDADGLWVCEPVYGSDSSFIILAANNILTLARALEIAMPALVKVAQRNDLPELLKSGLYGDCAMAVHEIEKLCAGGAE